MQLRKYQQEAITAVFDYYKRFPTGNVIVTIPTGGGKSLVQAEIIKRSLQVKPQLKFLLLAHVKELLEQNANELLNIWPEAPVGIYSAGLGKRELDKSITIAGIQSVYNKILPHEYDVIMVDECHRFDDTNDESMYMQLYNKLQPKRMIGLTATPFRTGKGMLTEEPSIWNRIVYNTDLRGMVKDGYLCNVLSKNSLVSKEIKADIKKLNTAGGEYVLSDASELMKGIQDSALDELVTLGKERKHWLLFACSVEQALDIRDYLINKHNISSQCVFGELSNTFRDDIISRFKEGEYRALININILTTGFNFPKIDLIATLRPTKSAIIYVQSIGRGMRNAEGKINCVFLDYAGWIDEFGPIDLIKITTKGIEKEAPHKTCPKCQTEIVCAYKICPECGYEFIAEAKAPDITKVASKRSLWSDEAEELEVLDIRLSSYLKKGKTIPTMRATYQVGLMRTVSEYVCFEHKGFALTNACKWWQELGGRLPIPDTVSSAIRRKNELKLPEIIQVIRDENGFERIIRKVSRSRTRAVGVLEQATV